MTAFVLHACDNTKPSFIMLGSVSRQRSLINEGWFVGNCLDAHVALCRGKFQTFIRCALADSDTPG